MKKSTFLIVLLLTVFAVQAQELYKATDGEISFFSETPMENIDAVNKNIKALINIKNGDFAFIVTNMGFKFEKALMEEHFNENYMESDKYKSSVFKGKIIGDVDYGKDGKYQVIVKGMLNVHGVEKEREIAGIIEVKKGKVLVTSEFDISLKEHKIKIPKLVANNISETVKVTVEINFELKK